MSLHRFFLLAPLGDSRPPAPAETVQLALAAADARHLSRVLRLAEGDRVVAVEPGGRQLVVRLAAVAPDVLGVVEEELPAREEPHVTLVQGVGKGNKTDLVVQKATELGVEAVLPVLTARSVVRFDARKRAERGDRWRRVAAEASKQSQRATVPMIEDPEDMAAVVSALAEFDRVVVPWEEAGDAPGMGAALAGLGRESRVAVVVGPEGGLAPSEIEAMSAVGAIPVTLGRNVLRTETAGIVAVALALYELGGLGGSRD